MPAEQLPVERGKGQTSVICAHGQHPKALFSGTAFETGLCTCPSSSAPVGLGLALHPWKSSSCNQGGQQSLGLHSNTQGWQ